MTLRLFIPPFSFHKLRLWPLSTLDYIKTLSILTPIHSNNSSHMHFTPFNGFLLFLHLLHYVVPSHSQTLTQSWHASTKIHNNSHNEVTHSNYHPSQFKCKTNKTCSNPRCYFSLFKNIPLSQPTMPLIMILSNLKHYPHLSSYFAYNMFLCSYGLVNVTRSLIVFRQ